VSLHCNAMTIVRPRVVPPHPQPFSPAKPGEKGARVVVAYTTHRSHGERLLRDTDYIGRSEFSVSSNSHRSTDRLQKETRECYLTPVSSTGASQELVSRYGRPGRCLRIEAWCPLPHAHSLPILTQHSIRLGGCHQGQRGAEYRIVLFH
jgi:hypothetical protein